MTKEDIRSMEVKIELGKKYLLDIDSTNFQINKMIKYNAEKDENELFSKILDSPDCYNEIGQNLVLHDYVQLKEYALELLRKRKEQLQKEFDEL